MVRIIADYSLESSTEFIQIKGGVRRQTKGAVAISDCRTVFGKLIFVEQFILINARIRLHLDFLGLSLAFRKVLCMSFILKNLIKIIK